MTAAPFPILDIADWAPTKKHLHLVAQMLGKLRLALAPPQPNWTFAALSLSARGITTGAIPCGAGAIQASIDLFTSEIVLETSDGRSARIDLRPARAIADVFSSFTRALAALDVEAYISPIPQELADRTPFDMDHRPTPYDPVAVQRWFTLVTSVAGVFEEWRGHFYGRSSVQLWWGAFDLSLMLRNGRRAPSGPHHSLLDRYDRDGESLVAGFYPGDESNPRTVFYGAIFPVPAGAENITFPDDDVFWSRQLGEWLLPYDRVRTAPDPRMKLCRFLDGLYSVCGVAAGWDLAALAAELPPKGT